MDLADPPPLPTVVVVDDAPDVRVLVRTRLRLSGSFRVVGEGGNGDDAVELAAQHQPDLMLLDVSMPGTDGLEALPGVLDVSPSTKVVMYSGFDEQGLADRARSLGAVAFVEKSTPVGELSDVLLGLLADGDSARAAQPPRAVAPGGQRREQEVLDEHVERFRQAFEQAAIGMATLTLTGHIVRVNELLAQLLGRPSGQLVGVQYGELLLPDDRRRVDETLFDLVVQGSPVGRVEHVVPGGPRVHVTLAPVRDTGGRPLYLFAQVQDVTAQRVAEEQLRQSEQRFRLLVETVQDYAIFMLDPLGHVVSWNAGAQRSKGYTADEIVGQHFRVFYPRDKQESRHPENELEWALRDGRYEEEGWRIRKDGTRFWANVVITAVHDGDGTHIGFAKVTRDISERRKMLEEREQAAQGLALAAEQQAEFLAVAAHELRTPIAVLVGSADTLSRHWSELTEDERDATLDSISVSSRRLRRLLADLLTAARLDADAVELHLEPVDVTALLEAAAAAAQSSAPEADIVVTAADGATALADPDRLAQAVDNLVANALRHGAGRVRLSAERVDRQVHIRVADDGAGVAPDVAERLFGRFVTGEARRGTGLGLFIVRELARAQGGEASYEPPTPDVPSGTFVLKLPAADKPAHT